MNLKWINLSERFFKRLFFQKVTYPVIPFIHFGKCKTKTTENKGAVAREGQGQGGECWKFEGTFQSGGNVLYLDCGGGHMGIYICQNLLNFILKMGVLNYSKI